MANKPIAMTANHVSLDSPYEYGNLKAILCWFYGHIFKLRNTEFYHDSSEFSFYECTRCGRIEGR